MSLVLACLAAGCGTLPGGRRWGQDATLLPSVERLRQSAVSAVTDPYTWVPAAGAAVFGLGNFDRRVSDWAREHRPLYGTRDRAANLSTDLVVASGLGWSATALATPDGEEPREFLGAKAKGFVVEAAALGTAAAATGALKGATGRRRPDGSDRQSFPSGHSTHAFGFASLGRRNLEVTPMNGALRGTLEAGFAGLAAGAAWARIEAGKHYPSDVLAGAALANLLTGFVHDAFLGLDPAAPSLTVAPSNGGLLAGLRVPF